MDKQRAIKIACKSSKMQRLIKKLILWEEELSMTGNAKRLSLTYGGAVQFGRRFGLECKKGKQGRPPGVDIVKKNVIKVLRDKGYTYQQIGDLFNNSRQRIQQISI